MKKDQNALQIEQPEGFDGTISSTVSDGMENNSNDKMANYKFCNFYRGTSALMCVYSSSYSSFLVKR
jgi:hypothetical protein